MAEKLIKPVLKDMFEVLKNYKIDIETMDIDSFIDSIPLSDSTMSRRIKLLAEDLEAQMSDGVRNSPVGHSFQTDESCDVENRAQLVSFIR